MKLEKAKLEKYFQNIDDDCFTKIQKIAVIEIGHAFTMAIKEKELEIAETMTKRKMSKV